MNTPHADSGPEPDRWCARHSADPSDGHRCGACIEAREWHTEWARRRKAFDTDTAHVNAREQANLNRLDIANCALCDERGYIGPAVCHHAPWAPAAAARGTELARAELTRHQPPSPHQEGAP